MICSGQSILHFHISCIFLAMFFFHFIALTSLHLMDLSLETLLSDAGVEPTVSNQLVSDGWTISSFREVVSDPTDFTDSLFDELCPGAALSLLQKASLKSAWRSVQLSSSSSDSAPSGAAQPSGTQPAAADNTWSEAFPPKLTGSTVSQLKQRFLTNIHQKF